MLLRHCLSVSLATNANRATKELRNTKKYVSYDIACLSSDTHDAADADSFTSPPKVVTQEPSTWVAKPQETFCTERDLSTAPASITKAVTTASAPSHHLPLARRRADLRPWHRRCRSYRQLKLSACVRVGGHRWRHRRPSGGNKSCWSISVYDQLQMHTRRIIRGFSRQL